MKLFVAILFAVCALAAADEWDNIDWDKVVPVEDLPGFWDDKDPMLVPTEESKRSPRVVGGYLASPHQFPYQVALLTTFGGGTGLCGGSIIGPTVVLTAAHCIFPGGTSALIIAGADSRLVVEANQQRRTVPSANFRVHAAYNSGNLNNDIATLVNFAAFTFNTFVQQIPIQTGTDTFAGLTSTVSGFGRTTDATQATSAQVRWVTMPVITNAACAATYGGIIIASTICTSTAGGRGTCNGDSGGPLTFGGNQIGVVSFVAAVGCQAGHPAGFARVTSFVAWINANRV